MGRAIEAIKGALPAGRKSTPLPSSGTGSWQGISALLGGGFGLPNERRYYRDVGEGEGSSIVQTAIDYVTYGFVEAPVRVQQKAGAASDDEQLTTIKDHGMVELIDNPNPYYDGALLWMATIGDFLLDGNAYWLIIPSAADRPAELYWIPHWFIEPWAPRDGSKFLSKYIYRPLGVEIDLAPARVVHFRWGMDPRNPLKGFSRFKKLLREIFTDEEAARFTAAMLRNMGVPGMIISPAADGRDWAPEEAEETKGDVLQKTSGEQRGQPLVFTSPTDVQMFGFTPAQMNLAELRNIPESRVAAAVGIPAAVLGFFSGMNTTAVGATMKELREQAYESGIIPKQTLIARQLKTQLLPHYTEDTKRYVVDFDLSHVRVLAENQDQKVERWKSLVGGPIAMRGEARADLNLATGPEDDVYYIPIAVIEEGPGAPEIDPIPAVLPPPPAQLPAPGQRAAQSPEQKAATRLQLRYLRTVDRAAQRIEPVMARELVAAFLKLGHRAESAYNAAKSRKDAGDEALINAITEALRLDDWKSDELDPVYRSAYVRTAQAAHDALGRTFDLGFGTDLPDEIARAVVRAGGTQLGLLDLTAQTRSALFAALGDAREEGLGADATARRIRQFVGAGRYTGMEAEREGAGVRYRSRMIARTEITYARNVATAEVSRSAGFTEYLAFDNRTGFDDEECASLDGQTVSFDEMMRLIAEEHPNGTRSFSPVPGSQATQ